MHQVRDTVAASAKTALSINRGLIFNLIRLRQPVSRAEVARLAGLQRSTVSRIVAELLIAGWVVEIAAAPGPLSTGRPPILLRTNTKKHILCIEHRSSTSTLAIGSLSGDITSTISITMPEDPVLAATKLIEQIKLFLIKNSEAAFDGIGISVSPRRHINLKGMLERALELPVEIENAANACAAGILWFGNPSHFRDLAVVIVSDNIDVSIVAGGRIVRGLGGTAGEFSHFPIEPNGPRCDCGNNGCWQALASQAAALRYYQELNPGSSPALTFPQLLTSAQQGDRLADCALQRMAVQLGRGIRMIVAGLAPEAVIVIGKAASLWRQFHPIIEAEVNTLRFSTLPPVLLAVHDETKAQMQGMIALLFQKNFGLLNAQ